MKKILIILFLFVIKAFTYSQKSEIGIIYSPILFSKLTFDQKYIIFSDYTSLTAGDNKYHTYFTGISTGVFYKYKFKRNLFFQTELDFFGNNFGSQIPDWASSRKKNFTYSSIDIPIICGFTLNPGSKYKLKVYGGLNNKFGKFITAFYSTITYAINDNMNQEYYYADVIRKKELIKKMSFYYMNLLAGIGITRYSTSIDLRFEKNITNLNKTINDYNANFKDLFLIRLCLTHTIHNKKRN
jgi:hypothetical protein